MKNQKRIKEKHQKRRKQEKYIAIIFGILLFVGIAVSIIALKGSGNNEELTKEMQGLWIYDSITSYQFDAENKGVLRVEDQEYHFTYKVRRDKVRINFNDDIVKDCVYGVSFENGYLYLEGGKGTMGGVYELEKKDI